MSRNPGGDDISLTPVRFHLRAERQSSRKDGLRRSKAP